METPDLERDDGGTTGPLRPLTRGPRLSGEGEPRRPRVTERTRAVKQYAAARAGRSQLAGESPQDLGPELLDLVLPGQEAAAELDDRQPFRPVGGGRGHSAAAHAWSVPVALVNSR